MCSSMRKTRGPVSVVTHGQICGAAFPMKPAALLITGVLPFSAQPPRCKGTMCRMCLPDTRSHGMLVQNQSPQAQGLQGQKKRRKPVNRMTKKGSRTYSKQATVPSSYSSMLPLGLFQWSWKEHKRWLQVEDGYSYWCHICSEGGELRRCLRIGCPAVQHRECSADRTELEEWQCDDCLWETAPEKTGQKEDRQSTKRKTTTGRTVLRKRWREGATGELLDGMH